MPNISLSQHPHLTLVLLSSDAVMCCRKNSSQRQYNKQVMGWKSLALQMIPWCVHVAGARRTSPAPTQPPAPGPPEAARLIGCDGRVRVFHRPVAAEELMREHPCHLVCRSDAFFIGQKVPPLAAAEQLQPGQAYFLLPSHFFHSVLSFVTLATSLVVGPGLHGKAPGVRPFDIHKTASGTLQVRLTDEFLLERVREEQTQSCHIAASRVVTTAALEKEYRSLVRCNPRPWAPKLETISESESRKTPFAGFIRSK